jgi:hypothetical protein
VAPIFERINLTLSLYRPFHLLFIFFPRSFPKSLFYLAALFPTHFFPLLLPVLFLCPVLSIVTRILYVLFIRSPSLIHRFSLPTPHPYPVTCTQNKLNFKFECEFGIPHSNSQSGALPQLFHN